ncbi:carbohydrate sulfotransferase 1-like isoform X2 [Argopecten irradians]|uniref:carbohydrate sulfotransferase 1-like isoform X2 n=1 Tax=Argopecten irradians TaxID=31199 RepID=UPI0037126ADF
MKRRRLTKVFCVFICVLWCFTSFLLLNRTNGNQVPDAFPKRITDNWDREKKPPKINSSKSSSTFERKDVEAETNGPSPVIILTYMRSGSSFLGEIFQANPQTFYWFEPVHELWGAYNNKKKVFDFQDGTNRTFKTFLDLAVPTIKNMSMCNLESIPVDALREQFISKSKQMTEFVKCRGYKEKGKATNKKLIKCLPKLTEKCLQSKHIVLKTIRISMKSLEFILEKIPTLKVIHLMRDPRGTSRSQKAVGQLSKHYREEISYFCKQVLQDIIDKEILENKYPGRIRTVFYEDVANSPLAYSKTLYQYLGMNFTSEVEKSIFQFTLAGKSGPKKCGILCTQMANSSSEASAWRSEINMELVKIVDSACSDLYVKVGYKFIPSEKLLRDKTFKLRE